MSVSAVRHRGTFGGALFGSEAAAGPERTAGRHFERAGNVALEDYPLARAGNVGVGYRHGGEKRLGIGMHRVIVELVGIGYLDYLSEVHYGDTL